MGQLLAKSWIGRHYPSAHPRIEAAYFLLDDFFRESGAVAQGDVKDLSWYGGRDHGTACFIMREPLRRTGRLERVRNCLKYHWGYDNIFKLPEGRQAMGMDYFYIDTHYLMRIALIHDTPAEIVSHLRAFARRFNIDIINTIEPDGSLYHHGFYNFPYVTGGLPAMASQINQLSTTPFAVSREAFEKAKLAAMDMRWFCNLTEAPISMHGRHPGRMGLSPAQYLTLAEAGRGYNDGRLDRELAAAYLRLIPAEASKPLFTAEGTAPEPAPQGNRALNYAALMGHRRGEWLAVIRGYSKYLPAQESYDNANRHGLFMGNGYLDILATGNPITIADSGCNVAKGWDWRHLDGTTSYFAPYAKIANGNGTLSERSDVGFAGGLSHGGKNGLFAMPVHSKFQYAKALPEGKKADPSGFFTANKSYFFFDNRIVCLGSDIALPDSPHEVRTTLFQKHLKEPATPILLDGQPVTNLPFQAALAPNQPHTLMDIQNSGYYLPAGQKAALTRQHQKSRDGHDEKDTEGDYTTAWIDHGVNPAKVGYEYVILAQTTPEQIARFAAAMAEPERPILVWRKDAQAHIVFDRQSKSWGGVFFTALSDLAAAALPAFPVTAVSQPCLVMIENLTPDKLAVSVGDPDLHLEKGISTPSTVTLTLAGNWKLGPADPAVRLTTSNGRTTLAVTCVEGRSFTFQLERQPGG
jgi:chondroitin-sulfate-ABC endolyase/exolyase